MRHWHAISGVMLGLTVAWGVGRWIESPAPTAEVTAAPMLAEAGPPLKRVVVHHPAGSTATADVIAQFLQHLDAGVTVDCVSPDRAAFEEFQRIVGEVDCRIRPVIVRHSVTAWSRDRWVVRPGRTPGEPMVLIRPRAEAGADTWPARRGDEQVATDLAARAGDPCVVQTSRLLFDAGDLLADDRHVFVTRAVLQWNMGSVVTDEARLLAMLTQMLGRPAVLLGDGPDHHAGMFMMSIGDGVALVGDPGMGLELLGRSPPPPNLPGGVDASAATQAQFDSVAWRLEGLGYRVRRVPTLVGSGTKAYVTYVNVLMDVDAAGRRIVYMPVYRGVDALNAAARSAWEAEGFAVREIDCTAVYPHFGTLHCLVNVLQRGH